MVAIDVLLLLHVPPPVPLVSVMVEPVHTTDSPPMAAGSGLTVMVTLPVIGAVQAVAGLVAVTV